MANFDEIIPIILAAEGGARITSDPHDPGGLTKYGISQKAYPDLAIQALTEEQARAIYRGDYWDVIRGDDLPDNRLAMFLMDMAVNMGVSAAVKVFQRCINRVRPLALTGIAVDGVVGTDTLEAIKLCAPKDLLRTLLRERIINYAHIIQKNPYQVKFLTGWINRSFDMAGII